MTKRASRQLVSKIRLLMISRLLDVLKAFVIQVLPRVGTRASIQTTLKIGKDIMSEGQPYVNLADF